MSEPVVVDASVVVAALVPEALSEPADVLMARHTTSDVELIGPPLLPIETTNALYQRLRRGEITDAMMAEALARLRGFGIAPVPVADLHELAFAFARDHGLTNIYDCVYVALARREGAELWTADAKLFRAMNPVAPWVRWIGDHR